MGGCAVVGGESEASVDGGVGDVGDVGGDAVYMYMLWLMWKTG